MYCVHSSLSVISMPKSLKHSLQILPSGSVDLSGTFSFTFEAPPGPFLAQKVMPLYLPASY